MNIQDLRKPLSVNDIEFRVQSINNGKYATILAYKDARCDMNRLDEVVGPLNWKREHSRENANCTVSIFDPETKQWVSKEDTGTESMTEAQKGLASDSFKRACFNWGIGRELYGYPRISIKLNDSEVIDQGEGRKPRYKAGYNFNLKNWNIKLDVDDNGVVKHLVFTDDKGNIRYEFGGIGKQEKPTTPQPKAEPKQGSFSKAKAIESLNKLPEERKQKMCKFFEVEKVESMSVAQLKEALNLLNK